MLKHKQRRTLIIVLEVNSNSDMGLDVMERTIRLLISGMNGWRKCWSAMTTRLSGKIGEAKEEELTSLCQREWLREVVGKLEFTGDTTDASL